MTRITRSATSIALALTIAASLVASARGASAQRAGDGGAAAANVLPKRWAKRHHVRRAAGDPDHDGLSNWGELRSRTRPRRADTDRDGVGDAREDRDGDGLDNGSEEDAGTDPARRDSGGDGPAGDDEPIASLAEQGEEDDPDDEHWDDDDAHGA